MHNLEKVRLSLEGVREPGKEGKYARMTTHAPNGRIPA
jgi:hypothetical protein